MTNQEIAKLFRNVAAAYTIRDENKYRFQIIAYQKATDIVEHASIELKDLYKEHSLENLPGIGSSIQSHLEELFKNGKVRHFEEVLNGIPEAVFPLLDVPSFGPKKAFKIVSHFKLKNPKTVLSDIVKLARDGRIAELEGFGEKSEGDILQALQEYNTGTTKSGRMVLPYAYSLAQKVVEYMRKSSNIVEVQPLGSLRRMVSTIGDIDIAVTSEDSKKVIDYFCEYPHKERVIEKGPTTASILVSGGKHIDIMVLNPDMWGSLLQHFTGSKHHNVALREYAIKKGYSLSERGIKLLRTKNKELKTFRTEDEFYKFLRLDWVPPEIRENQGEIEAAQNHTLPKLVDASDIKGDLHIHSNYPINSSHDYGDMNMEEAIKQAKRNKYEYIGFSEHNPKTSGISKSDTYSILSERKDIIEQIKKSNNDVRIINLLEVDILASGELAVNEKGLEFVDAMIVSIHSSFSTAKDKMTDRILKGLSHPKAKILAHPTGRLLNNRAGYEVDWDKLFDFVKTHDKALEINAWPERLDLPDILVKDAKENGVKFVINTDSHSLSHMDNMLYGVSVARRGWCERKDILNTLPYEDFIKWVQS